MGYSLGRRSEERYSKGEHEAPTTPPGDGAALEDHAVHLVLERTGAPALHAAQRCIELTPERVVDGDQLPQMGPAQLSPQRGHNLAVRENLREAHHPVEAALVEATAEIRGQRARDTLNDAEPGELVVSRQGTMAVARVRAGDDEPLTVVAGYGVWERPDPTTGSN